MKTRPIDDAPPDFVGDPVRRANWDNEAGLAIDDDIVGARVSGGDNGQSTSHCFLLNEGASLDDRRQNQHVAVLHELEHFAMGPWRLINEITKMFAIPIERTQA